LIRECEQAGIAPPLYFYDMSGFFVEFRKQVYDEDYLSSLGLNSRQIKAVFYTKINGKITNKYYQDLNHVSRNTAANELRDLVVRNILKSNKSRGKGSFYTL
jgi:ATP-dependent DNA helicase RecG